jgi:hypothetical protein
MARYLWTQKADIGPSSRVGHAMTYDSARSRTILFGGDPLASALLNDTWEWDGELWTQTADIGPGPRRDHALCFDNVRNTALLFGGLSGSTRLGDTWSWDGQDWTQLEDTGPSARAGHAMVFDAARGRAVLFGGESATGLVNDTWEWDGQAWTQQEDTGPSPRKNYALAFDLAHNRVVLFGGDPGSGNALGDTWSWDGSNWAQIADFGANPCLRAAMISTDTQMSMFGGLNSANTAPAPTVFHETWVFDGQHWMHRQDIGPGPRWAHAMAYDAARRSIVLFGGLPIFGAPGDAALPGRLLGDTWEHTETEAATPPPPAPGPAPGTGINVKALTLSPATVAAGGQVTASITLDAPAPAGIEAELVWVLASVFSAMSSGAGFTNSDINHIIMFPVSAGAATASTTFAAPALSPQPVEVLAVTNTGGTPANATLMIV